MRIIHCISGLEKRSGGPSVAIPAFCGALAQLGHEVTLVTGVYGGDQELAEIPVGVNLVTHPASRRLNGRSPQMRDWFSKHVTWADVVHAHGLWMRPTHYALHAAHKHGIPSILAPIGMFEPEALRTKRLLKTLYWPLFEHPALLHTACFHATSTSEVRNIGRRFAGRPICLVPNGVDLPTLVHDSSKKENIVLFLGRIHPHKNVTMLLDSWLQIAASTSWRLVIAGPIEGLYGEQVRQRAAAIGPSVEIIGPVWGDAKIALLRRASLLVLPSKSENFGMVVAEALACGTPAIATQGAPWSELEEHRCGWWIPAVANALTQALRSALGQPTSELVAMGRRGRALIEERYIWSRMGKDLANVYSWLIDDTPAPPCVEPRLAELV